MRGLNQLFQRIPIALIAVGFLAYLAGSYYIWTTSDTSELALRKQALVNSQQNLTQLQAELAKAEAFLQSLDTIRARIRALAQQLEETKDSLSSEVDIGNFVKILNLESNKVKLRLKGIKPEVERKRDYYVEVPFVINLKGAYIQILVFLDRISRFQQIVNISDFQLKPSGNNLTNYVELDGSVRLVTYKYLGSSADQIGKKQPR